MNQVIALMSPKEVEATRAIIAAEIEPLMSADVSTYARGRRRAWLGPEPRLGAKRGRTRRRATTRARGTRTRR